jgi:RHH-type proline utilization regulon transcriptional repressor/proline dehydrogenase/delta 1-pyrroline-5-carboxylate dehydrogenase
MSDDPLRRAIAARTRAAESDVVQGLLAEALLPPEQLQDARAVARTLVENLRARRSRSGGVDALMHEFSLSSSEGVALMCLAEALLRIPDHATADALIRDKVSRGDWRAHLGRSQSLFVNAAAWGLMVTGSLVSTHSDEGLGRSLTQLIARGGEPLIRKAVDLAMRLLGQQFVTGQTIEEALANARDRRQLGYRYTFDMLGEAALTAADAAAYFSAYTSAIAAIGATNGGLGAEAGPGISVKLSALHPRYCRAQRGRVLAELLPRLRELCLLARGQDMGLAIDAEESERLDLSLELTERLAEDSALAGWDGLGVVVQSYQKRAPQVVDWVIDLARRCRRRLSVRLVKGAYWDSEIKRAQVEGQAGYPVFTRKMHSDACYLACARRLLAAADAIYPQFATHNAMTLASVREMARAAGVTHYEFQCLHGMGESLYDQVLGPDRLDVACRIYAPVGSHETLLAYLVRRLLENGSNSSFVNQILDPAIGIDDLLRDPVQQASEDGGSPHPRIALPIDLFAPERRNSAGLDLNDEATLLALEAAFAEARRLQWCAAPVLADRSADGGEVRAVRNPARLADVIGQVQDASRADLEAALAAAQAHTTRWSQTAAGDRAQLLDRVADLLEAHRDELMWLAVHEAGKTLANALGEVREAVDFCRYYASQVRAPGCDANGRPLGVVACISPWNFPLAIFIGQVTAALAAGNVVVAKPAEQTPLIAAHAVRLMHRAGVPRAALQMLPGDGGVGALLVADARVRGVLFTGSTEVAALIDRLLAARSVDEEIVLVAETGGINAMVVDSSALPEQVVADVLASGFDSAGQRCSALRLLCLQEEIADRLLSMLHGAMHELSVGDPARLETDIGPVIDADARALLESHVARMLATRRGERLPLPAATAQGTFVAPTVIEIDALGELEREVFGPVVHVLRFRRGHLGALIEAINATGYGLTFGVHSRIDETIDFVTARIRAGNVYVNRNMIGAVVGVQPFGGLGLSGTGPKAGGALMLPRLRRCARAPAFAAIGGIAMPPALRDLQAWAEGAGHAELASHCAALGRASALAWALDLPGPTGESNRLRFTARGRVLCVAGSEQELLLQIAAALATGNRFVLCGPGAEAALARLPSAVRRQATIAADAGSAAADVALCAPAQAAALRRLLAARDGPRVRVVTPLDDRGEYPIEALVVEQTLTVNTAAAGGNASLMTLEPA